MTRVLVPDPAVQRENEIQIFREDPFTKYCRKLNVHDHMYGFILVDTNSLSFRGLEFSVERLPEPIAFWDWVIR
jgi:hypothetical protein